MATIHTQKNRHRCNRCCGSYVAFHLEKSARGAVLSYFAYPVPEHASGPHGSTSGSVAVTRVTCTWIRDNFNSDTRRVVIDVLNTGNSATGYELYQSWID